MNPLLAILAIIPGLAICYGIYRWDIHEKESYWYLLAAFAFGVICCFPAMLLEAWGMAAGYDEFGGIWELIVFCYVIIGGSEELVKYLVLVLLAYPRRAFNEPLDGIVYAVMIGMGFATLENLIYADRFNMGTIVVRAFTAVPAHAMFAIFMGYYVGQAKFTDNRRRQIQLLALGLVIPILVHGTYDIFILQQYYDWLMLFGTVTLLISSYFAYKMIKIHQAQSPFKKAVETASTEGAPLAQNEIMDAILKDLEEEE